MCRSLGVSKQSYYRWCRDYGDLRVNQAPLSSLPLGELSEGILPPGVFNIVTGDGATGSCLLVVVDVCRYDRMFDSDRNGPIGDNAPTLARWVVDPAKSTVVETLIAEGHHEFPNHDPRVSSQRHRYAYTADGLELGPTHRVDVESGEVVRHDHGEGRFGAEPLLVPKAGSTEEGISGVLVCVNDRDGGPAELVVLDGEDIDADPVARIHLPRRVPDGFHGAWVPDDAVPPT